MFYNLTFSVDTKLGYVMNLESRFKFVKKFKLLSSPQFWGKIYPALKLTFFIPPPPPLHSPGSFCFHPLFGFNPRVLLHISAAVRRPFWNSIISFRNFLWGLGWVFKAYFSWHSNQCQCENRFLRADVSIETCFPAGRNADWNNL